jgi:hypothetical protein
VERVGRLKAWVNPGSNALFIFEEYCYYKMPWKLFKEVKVVDHIWLFEMAHQGPLLGWVYQGSSSIGSQLHILPNPPKASMSCMGQCGCCYETTSYSLTQPLELSLDLRNIDDTLDHQTRALKIQSMLPLSHNPRQASPVKASIAVTTPLIE